MEEASTIKPKLSYPSAYAKKPYTPSQRGKEIVASKISLPSFFYFYVDELYILTTPRK